MTRAVRLVGGGVMLVAASSAVVAAQPAPAAAGPSVMSDTVEYCHAMAARVASAQKSRLGQHPDVDMLSHEGLRLCEGGHVRMGVQRLRSAWMLLRQREPGGASIVPDADGVARRR